MGTGASRRARARRAGAALVWVLVWFAAARAMGDGIVLAGPIETLAWLGSHLADGSFWLAVGRTFAAVAASSAAAGAAGAVLGGLAARFEALDALLAPAVQAMKSAPVACVAVLLLVLVGSRGAVAAVVAFVALPPFYVAALEASRARPRDAERVLRALGVPRVPVFLACTWPACLPLFSAAAKTAVALSWRAGVMGELLGVPLDSIGAGIYAAKLTLDTAGLLAWTLVVMLLGWACERAVVALLDATARSPRLAVRLARARRRPDRAASVLGGGSATGAAAGDGAAASGVVGASGVAPAGSAARPAASVAAGAPFALELSRVDKAFGAHAVLRGVSLAVRPAERVCLMAPTGGGKTTLLRIALGFEAADAGEVRRASCAPVLQAPALVERLSALDNVLLASDPARPEASVRAMVEGLLPEGCADRPACELSGGTRRLTELARAMCAPGACLVLDEPFSGLDDAARLRACRLLDGELHGRALVMATHDARDADALAARIVRLA